MRTAWALILCFLFCQTANAATYRFVGSDFPILSGETEDGELRGIAIDVAIIISHRLGHTIKIRLYPWELAKFMVKNGLADVLMAPHKNHEREKWFDYLENYFFTDKTFFYVAPDWVVRWNGDYAFLYGRTIGLVQSWSVDASFDQAKASLIETDDRKW